MKKIILLIAFSVLLGSLVFAVFSSKNGYSIGVGDKAADFSTVDLNGNLIELSNVLKDKVVVMVFWTTWCPSCRKEMPHVEKFHKENIDKVVVLGINAGETDVKVKSIIEKENITYTIVVDANNNLSRKYNIVGVPTIIAIGRDSNILYYGHSIDEMKNKVEF